MINNETIFEELKNAMHSSNCSRTPCLDILDRHNVKMLHLDMSDGKCCVMNDVHDEISEYEIGMLILHVESGAKSRYSIMFKERT